MSILWCDILGWLLIINVDTNGFHELLKHIKKPVIYVNYHPQTHLDLPLIFWFARGKNKLLKSIITSNLSMKGQYNRLYLLLYIFSEHLYEILADVSSNLAMKEIQTLEWPGDEVWESCWVNLINRWWH